LKAAMQSPFLEQSQADQNSADGKKEMHTMVAKLA
jgi:hypothetical protein